MKSVLETLDGRLVVSCQPVSGGPLDSPHIVTALALASLAGGAGGLRIEGLDNLRAVREKTGAPVIGIMKRDLADSPVRITPRVEDVRSLANAGADVIAYDATDRPRPVATAELVMAIREAGKKAMADCANLADAKRALAEGADILGTTLSGYAYREAPANAPPDLALVRDMSTLGAFLMAEGRISSPEAARAAIKAGANSVTVGTVLTRLELMTRRFADAVATKNDV